MPYLTSGHTTAPNGILSDRALAKVDACEKNLRQNLEDLLCRLPLYLRYRNAAILHRLRVVADLIREAGLHCPVTGGLAYDALRGKFTRVHHDLDLMFLSDIRPSVLASFEAAGFLLQEKSPYHTVARAEDDLRVDLFCWIETADHAAEHICGGVMVRMPRAFLTGSQTACLHGVRLTLPSNNYLKGIRPFVEAEADRRFLADLPTNPLLAYDQRRETVVRRISLAVHEFTVPPEP